MGTQTQVRQVFARHNHRRIFGSSQTPDPNAPGLNLHCSGCRSSPISSNAASQDILIACVDGLKGFPEAIEALSPENDGADVHRSPDPPLIALRPAPAIRRRGQRPRTDLPAIDADHGARGARGVRGEMGRAAAGDRPSLAVRWQYVIPFMAYEPEVRRVIYAADAIEALQPQLRKALKTKGSFPSREPLGSCSTSRSRTPSPNRPGPAGGRKPCSPSKSNSETDCPTNHQPPPTQRRRTPSMT